VSFEITVEDFRAIRDLIRARFGIYYDDAKQFLLLSRLQTRLVKRGLDGYGAYVQFLQSSPQRDTEWFELASVLSNNETYFFRERAQLRSLAGDILTELQALLNLDFGDTAGSLILDKQRSRVEKIGRIAENHISIVATDISQRVLDLCQKGFYRALSFRATEPAMVQKFFSPMGEGFLLHERIRKMVAFSTLNLMDANAIAAQGPLDAIFCRNVLIYFDKPTQKRVVEAFAKALRPGGYLFLGHAESLFHLTDVFEPIVQPETIVYRVRAIAPASVRA